MLLLHVCCGPCLTFPAGWLRERKTPFQAFFFNPNIHPYGEFRKRLEAAETFAEKQGIQAHLDRTYGLVEFIRAVAGKESERCEFCYRWRLEATARRAKELGCKAFSTTMLVSPYQKHERLQVLGEDVGRQHGVEFFYADWREGYRRGIQIARDAGLYRQRYCGCIYSEAEREGVL